MKRTTKPTPLKIQGFQPLPATKDLMANPNIPTIFADIVNTLFSNDGLTQMSFFSRAHGINIEGCRVMFTHALAKKIVDLFCAHLNYYPINPASQTENKKEGRKLSV